MSMIISIMSITALVMMTGYILLCAKYAVTRRLAGITIGMTVGEVLLFGLLSGVTNPAVMMLLVAARVTILVVCAMAMRADREAAKARVRLRNRFHADLYNTMYSLKLVRRERASACIDIAA